MAVKLSAGQRVNLGETRYKRHYSGITEEVSSERDSTTMNSSKQTRNMSSASKICMMTSALR